MDKNTLSNYGWIVIAVLVLSVMIALATPFGEYIKAGVESTTAGLFDTSEKALNVVGMSAKTDETEKATAKGSYISVNDVAPIQHNLKVTLSSNKVSDFSSVNVTCTGKNLIDINDLRVYGCVRDLTINSTDNQFEFTKNCNANVSTSAVAVDVYLPAGTYTLSADVNKIITLLVLFKDTTTNISNQSIKPNSPARNFVVEESNTYTILLCAQYTDEIDSHFIVSNLQLEVGDNRTEFEPNTKQTVTANADGTVSGLKSVSPNMTIIADADVEITCEYQKKKLILPPPTEPEKTNSVIKSVESVKDGDVVYLETNAIKKNKKLSFNADITSLNTIILRHGQNAWGIGYLTIDNTDIKYYRYSSGDILIKSSPHGLTISGKTTIIASVGKDSKLSISITSNGKTFTDNTIWYGSRGNIEMESVSTTMKNLTLMWECADYTQDIWFFGDSYFEINSTRWPHYLLKQKDNFLLSGFGGAGASQMYADFQTALTHGTPKFAVWCLGMNNGDSESGINQSWKTYTEKFIADCEANGITPILTTTPNTPTVINIYKNEYVKNSGYRYIDFASAVGANEKGSSWYEGMLSSDNVHPATEGGKALANQILVDLPEIK